MGRGAYVPREPADASGSSPGVAAQLLDSASWGIDAAAATVATAIPAGWTGGGAQSYRTACDLLARRTTALGQAAAAVAQRARLHGLEVRRTREALAAGAMVPA